MSVWTLRVNATRKYLSSKLGNDCGWFALFSLVIPQQQLLQNRVQLESVSRSPLKAIMWLRISVRATSADPWGHSKHMKWVEDSVQTAWLNQLCFHGFFIVPLAVTKGHDPLQTVQASESNQNIMVPVTYNDLLSEPVTEWVKSRTDER